jgi:chitinase
MVYPADGKVVKGTQVFAATASFNVGLSKVEFQATGNGLLNTAIGTAFITHGLRALRWNTTGFPNGTYTIRAVGYDAAGAASASKGLTVHVQN